MNRLVKIVAIVILLVVGTALALWLYICLFPGVIYCYNGGIYMSQPDTPPFNLRSLEPF